MRISRRALFFFAVAAVFLLMIPPTPNEFRWLNLVMAGLALFWAVLLSVEDVAGDRRARDRSREDPRPSDPRA